MLSVALLAIGALALVEKIDFQIKRDREEELVHRGVQYSRAVQHYFKKFGKYPNRIEELEDTNNIRFLRQRYKDPITGKDFKLLHITDVQMSFNPGAIGGIPPGQTGGPGALQAPPPGTGSANGPGAGATGIAAQPFQGDPSGNGMGPRGPSAVGGAAPTGDPGLTANNGQGDPGQNSDNNGPQTVTTPTPNQQSGAIATSSTGPQVFGGGAIVGVASSSKLKTIREFNKKDHYNQWQFIYDPSSDTGGLLMTPNQPPLKGATPITPMAPGSQPQPGVQGDQVNRGNPVQPPASPPDQQ